MQLFAAVAGVGIAVVGCATSATIPAKSATVLPLREYVGRLRYLESKSLPDARLLFDSAGGITLLSPVSAHSLGCVPYTTLTALRMNGDRFVAEGCGPTRIAFGSLILRPEAAVFDLMSLLPPELPKLDGVVSLQTFADRVVILDLANNELTISDTLDPIDVRDLEPIAVRLSRPFAGAGLDVFARVTGSRGPLWFELDSGNLDAVLVSNRVLEQLALPPGLITQLRAGLTVEAPIPIDGLGSIRLPVKTANIIYDGVLNAESLERLKIVLDLRHSLGWASLNSIDLPPNPNVTKIRRLSRAAHLPAGTGSLHPDRLRGPAWGDRRDRGRGRPE